MTLVIFDLEAFRRYIKIWIINVGSKDIMKELIFMYAVRKRMQGKTVKSYINLVTFLHIKPKKPVKNKEN